MTDSRSTLDDEVDDEPIEDSRETCGFWYSREGRCRIGPLSFEVGGPCPDCPNAPPSRREHPETTVNDMTPAAPAYGFRCGRHRKVAFTSRAAARERLAEIRAAAPLSGETVPVRAYGPDRCGFWHLTSQPADCPGCGRPGHRGDCPPDPAKFLKLDARRPRGMRAYRRRLEAALAEGSHVHVIAQDGPWCVTLQPVGTTLWARPDGFGNRASACRGSS